MYNKINCKSYVSFILIYLIAGIFLCKAQNYSGGNGTEVDPYKISTAGDLKDIATAVNGGNSYENRFFIMTNDIDLKSVCGNGTNGSVNANWTPIGEFKNIFSGNFNGGGYSIRGLYFKGSTSDIGLFGFVGGSTIKRLTVIEPHIEGNALVGGVIARVTIPFGSASSHIEGVNVTGGTLTAIGEGAITGGIVGYLESTTSKIIACTVSGVSMLTNNDYGGICSNLRGTMVACLSDISPSSFNNFILQGILVGYNKGTITSCYFNPNATIKAIGIDEGSSTNIAAKTITEMNQADFLTTINQVLTDHSINFKYEVNIGKIPKLVAKTSSYTLTFNANGGNVTNPISKTVNLNAAIGTLPTPTRNKYTFKHWTLDGVLITDQTLWTIEASKEVVAQWWHSVNYNANGGSPIASTMIDSNQGLSEPTTPTKANNVFIGWYKESSLTTQWNFITDRVTENMTLYAKWTSPTTAFTVTFNSNAGSAVASKTATVGKLIAEPNIPTKTGFSFSGWYQEIGLTNVWRFHENVVLNNITLHAKWISETLLYYVSLDGRATWSGKPYGLITPKPTDPVKEGHTFIGWYEQNSGKKWDFDKDKVVSHSMNLLSRWNVGAVEQFTVTFESNGGTTVNNQTINAGEKIPEPTPPPTKDNAIFEGWYKDNSLNTSWNFATDKVNSNITLYAKWISPTSQFTVTFESNGGTAVTKITNITAGNTVKKPANPTRNNYTFVNWYKEATFTTVWDFNTNKVTSNITLYAKWNAVTTTVNYTVTFETNGGSTVKNMTIKANTAFKSPSNPTKIGYTFGGWYKEEKLASVWNFNTKVIADITLYAKWIPINYKVTFNSNKGTTVPFANVAHNNTLTSPKDPTKKGYTFGGWYKEMKLLTAWDFSNDVVTKAITLYAKWDAPTGIIKEDYLLKLYPNPATTEIKIENIEQTEAATIEIFDLTGKLVRQVLVGEYIDVSALPQGIYSVKAGNYTAKFMKR